MHILHIQNKTFKAKYFSKQKGVYDSASKAIISFFQDRMNFLDNSYQTITAGFWNLFEFDVRSLNRLYSYDKCRTLSPVDKNLDKISSMDHSDVTGRAKNCIIIGLN